MAQIQRIGHDHQTPLWHLLLLVVFVEVSSGDAKRKQAATWTVHLGPPIFFTDSGPPMTISGIEQTRPSMTMVDLQHTIWYLVSGIWYMVSGIRPDTRSDLPDTMGDLPDTMRDLPDTIGDLPDTMDDLPDTMGLLVSCCHNFKTVPRSYNSKVIFISALYAKKIAKAFRSLYLKHHSQHPSLPFY